MMRYQRVSPDCLVLPSGRRATVKSFKDADDADARISKDSYPPFDAKPLRVRSGSGSASGSANPATQTRDPQTHDYHEVDGRCSDVLLQWGHNKRSRGSRADSHRAAGDESSVHQRQHVKIQRRAAIAGAERIAAAAAAAMPPPCGGGYSRGSNLRACMPSRDSTGTHHNRTVEDRSNGHHRPDKRSPPSPPEKPAAHNHCKAAAAASNGFGSDPSSSSMSQHPDPKHRSDHDDTVGSGSGSGGPTPAAEKVSLQHLEWPRIYISLSRKEKEDDFLAMKGTKLPQRPKKRAKNIDKSLQYVFPGMWLSDLTRGRYEVREKKCVKKRRRGLKGMESMDSDSE